MISNRKSRKGELRRGIPIASAVIVGTFRSVWAAAELDMARERAGREYLGDLLCTETRGNGDPPFLLAGLQVFVDALGFGRSPWPRYSDYWFDVQLAALRLAPIEDARRVTAQTGATLIEVPGDHQQYFQGGVQTIERTIKGIAVVL